MAALVVAANVGRAPAPRGAGRAGGFVGGLIDGAGPVAQDDVPRVRVARHREPSPARQDRALRSAAAAAAAVAACSSVQCGGTWVPALFSRSPRRKGTSIRIAEAQPSREIKQTSALDKIRLTWTDLDSAILRVWLPVVANLILFPLVGAVDLFWVARLGDPLAIAGMGAANQVYNTIYFFISFLPAVVTPLIAKEIAQGNSQGAADFIGQALALASVMGIFGTIALTVFPAQVLAIISSNPAVLASATPYIRIRGLSLIPTLWSTVCFATFRGILDFKTPLKVSLATNLINMLLDPILMFGCGFGVAGAAGATSVAEFLCAAGFVALLRTRGFVQGMPRLPSRRRLATLLGSGLALQVRSVSTNAIFLFAVRKVTAIDPTGIQAAAYQVTMQFWNLAGFVSLGLSTTGSGLVPNELYRDGVGAARRAADRLQLWGWGLGLFLGMLQLLALPLIGVMTPSVAVQQAARVPSILAALLQILNGAVFAGEGMLLGLRAYKWCAVSSGLGCLGMISTIALAGEHALTGVWIGLFVFNLIRLCGSMSYRFKFGLLAQRNAIHEQS